MNSLPAQIAIQSTFGVVGGALGSRAYGTSPLVGAAFFGTTAAISKLLEAKKYLTVNDAIETFAPLAFTATLMKIHPALGFYRAVQVCATSKYSYVLARQLWEYAFSQPNTQSDTQSDTQVQKPPKWVLYSKLISPIFLTTALFNHSGHTLVRSLLKAVGLQFMLLISASSSESNLIANAKYLGSLSLGYLQSNIFSPSSINLASYSVVLLEATTHAGIFIWSVNASDLAGRLANKISSGSSH